MAVIFWLALALVGFTYAGYPLVLWVRAALFPKPVGRAAVTPAVVMVVVAYNEESRIEAKLKTCLNQLYPADKLSVVVVSDGSTDQTNAIVRSYPDARVRLIEGVARRGKAACLNDAVLSSNESVIVFTDARQRLHPEAVSRLVSNFADDSVGVVSGELVFENADGSPFADGIGAYWLYEKFIRNNEAATGSVIGVTGALYAIRRECYEPIPAETILDDVLIPMQAAMKGWRVTFEKGAIAYDLPSADAAREKVRKVRTLAGNFQIVGLQRRLLSPVRNPLWGRFVAHKMLRLAGPFALALALFAHTALAWSHEGFYRVSWFAHVSAYFLIGAALLYPALQRFKIVRLGVTFAHLNIFVLQGLASHLTQRQGHLWGKSNPEEKNSTQTATGKDA